MFKIPFLKADLSRVTSTFSALSIGKWIPLLIAPVALLFAYGKVQATQRQVAEQRVEQLTNDVRILSTSLAQVEQFVTASQVRATDHANRLQVLNNEEADVLDLPAPDSVVELLRHTPVSSD